MGFRITRWLLVVSAGFSCGDNRPGTSDGSTTDTKPDGNGPCWPVDTSTPKGTIELGTGEAPSSFIPMPAEINLIYGAQGGFHIPALARITGLEPGDPLDIFNPKNPRSRFMNFFPDTGEPTYQGNCPIHLGYAASGAPDVSITPNVIEMRFFETLGPADLFDKQFRAVVEVIDSTGGYAKDEKLVTVRAPVGWAQ